MLDFTKLKISSFKPHKIIRGGHLQTLAGEFYPDRLVKKRDQLCMKSEFVLLDDGDKVIVDVYSGGSDIAIVLGHGLTGHSNADYIIRLATILSTYENHTVVCMNHRNCGVGKGLSTSMYHSGRSEDLAAVVRYVRNNLNISRVYVVGFSMSGNVVLKLAGEQEIRARECIPDGCISVNAPVNLKKSSLLINRGFNKLYQANFLKQIHQLFKELYPNSKSQFKSPGYFLVQSLYDFDDKYTGPYSGFLSADDYYEKCSAKNFFSKISIPTVMISSEDDPFVDYQDYQMANHNPFISLQIQKSGGHMGYISDISIQKYGRRWVDYSIVESLRFLSSPKLR